MEREGLILLADDDTDTVAMIRMAFKTLDRPNRLFSVSDGEEAIQYLKGVGPYANRRKFPLPQLLLLDLKMPRVDGFEVLRWIRKESNFRSLTVIVLAGSTFDADVKRAYADGANSFMVKAHGLPEIAEQLRLIVDLWMTPAWLKWVAESDAA